MMVFFLKSTTYTKRDSLITHNTRSSSLCQDTRSANRKKLSLDHFTAEKDFRELLTPLVQPSPKPPLAAVLFKHLNL